MKLKKLGKFGKFGKFGNLKKLGKFKPIVLYAPARHLALTSNEALAE